MRIDQATAIREGAMFCVPLAAGAGYGYGYVALARTGWGYLYDVYDRIGQDETPPDGIEDASLAVRNLLGSGGEFLAATYNPRPWRLLDRQVRAIAPLGPALFQVGSKILDMRDGRQVIDASIELKGLPYKEYPTDDEHSYLVTARLLGCDYRYDQERGAYELLR